MKRQIKLLLRFAVCSFYSCQYFWKRDPCFSLSHRWQPVSTASSSLQVSVSLCSFNCWWQELCLRWDAKAWGTVFSVAPSSSWLNPCYCEGPKLLDPRHCHFCASSGQNSPENLTWVQSIAWLVKPLSLYNYSFTMTPHLIQVTLEHDPWDEKNGMLAHLFLSCV